MNTTSRPKATLLAAWLIILLSSLLPNVVLQEIFGMTVTAELQTIIALSVSGVALLATLIWPALRGLRGLLVVLIVLTGSQWLVFKYVSELFNYPAWLKNPSFNFYMLAEQSLNLLITLAVIAALLLMKKKPKDFFLARGNLAAPAGGVRCLGIDEGTPWNKLGLWLTLFISLGTLAFLVLAGRPSLDIVVRALPFLPAILLAAAMNAFYEELTYKASFLSVLESPVGSRQALYMVAVFFGIWHYYGVPYGVVGVVLATFLGWILARSMQETRGMFWAWFIHFWQDVWIFSFLAIGSIIPGGG